MLVVLNRLSELFRLTRIQAPSPHRGEGGGEGDKKTQFTYDKNGNLTKKIEFDDEGKIKTITLYTYDFENRLIMVVKQEEDETKTISFKYDPFGRRIEKKAEELEDGKTETKTYTYIYDNENIILEYLTKTEDGKTKTEITRYIHGNGIDEPLAIERKGEVYYYHTDGLGSITALTDKKQKMVESYTYSVFGEVKQKGDKVKNTYTFTAREWDKKTGLYYYRARYYDAKVGRFLQKDPFPGLINLPQTLNHHSYVGNNPVKFIDPFGLSSLTYDFNTGSLSLYDSGGSLIGQFPAGNNTTADSNGSWPPGTYPYSYYVPHPESEPTGPYGSHGNFVFDVPGRAGMGVHSGRQNPQYPTRGCIRTTDEATETIKNLNTTDPLTSITVR